MSDDSWSLNDQEEVNEDITITVYVGAVLEHKCNDDTTWTWLAWLTAKMQDTKCALPCIYVLWSLP